MRVWGQVVYVGGDPRKPLETLGDIKEEREGGSAQEQVTVQCDQGPRQTGAPSRQALLRALRLHPRRQGQ